MYVVLYENKQKNATILYIKMYIYICKRILDNVGEKVTVIFYLFWENRFSLKKPFIIIIIII